MKQKSKTFPKFRTLGKVKTDGQSEQSSLVDDLAGKSRRRNLHRRHRRRHPKSHQRQDLPAIFFHQTYREAESWSWLNRLSYDIDQEALVGIESEKCTRERNEMISFYLLS